MNAIEKTALVESNFFFNTEETAMFEKVWGIFTIFRDVVKEVGEHADYPCLMVTDKEGKKTRFDEEDINEILNTINIFCKSASIKAMGD